MHPLKFHVPARWGGLVLCAVLALFCGPTAALAQSQADSLEAALLVPGGGAALLPAVGGERLLPVRSVAGAAAILSGVEREPGDDRLIVRAARPSYYLDGIPLPAGFTIPWHAVASVDVWREHVPVQFGQSVGGVIDVRTRPAAPGLSAMAEGLSSRGFDAFGHSLGALTFSGSGLKQRLRIFVAGEIDYRADSDPRAASLPRLRDDLAADLMQNPQAIRATNPATGEVRDIPLPGNLPDGTAASSIQLPEGFVPISPNPVSRFDALSADAFTRDPSKRHHAATTGSILARVDFDVTPRLTAALTGHFDGQRRDLWELSHALFSGPAARLERDAGRIHGLLTFRAGSRTELRAGGGVVQVGEVTHNAAFTPAVEDLLFYGDIDHPANAAAGRYKRYDSIDDAYVKVYRDGWMPGPIDVQNVFALPGASFTGYRRSEDRRIDLHAGMTHRAGAHAFTLGATAERHTRRRFEMANPYQLARYFDDDHDELGPSVTGYREIPADVLAQEGVRYYGYDFLGLQKVASQDVDAFATRKNFDLQPFEISRLAGYASDRWQGSGWYVDAGLRIDGLSHNQPVLFDPYSLFPVVRAADLPARPAGISGDAAVYFDALENVRGFRDRSGRYYDAQGLEVERSVLRAIAHPSVKTDASGMGMRNLTAEIFVDHGLQLAWQPRIEGAVRITEGTWVTASYDRLAEWPLDLMDATLLDYQRNMARAGILPNPALGPEWRTSYRAEVHQLLPRKVDIRAGAFLRLHDDIPGIKYREGAFPNNYFTYDNAYHGTLRGFDIELFARPLPALTASASYTFQSSSGTAPDAAARPLWWFQSAGGPSFQSVPFDLERKHQLSLLLGFRTRSGEGPLLFGARPFARTSVHLSADVKSGRPYSSSELDQPTWIAAAGVGTGNVNESRMPWSKQLDVRVERALTLGSANLAAFLWIENLLGAANVLGVYGFTGLPDEDGWLQSATGRAWLGQQSGTADEYYRMRLRDPQHYGIPRLVRVGMKLAL